MFINTHFILSVNKKFTLKKLAVLVNILLLLSPSWQGLAVNEKKIIDYYNQNFDEESSLSFSEQGLWRKVTGANDGRIAEYQINSLRYFYKATIIPPNTKGNQIMMEKGLNVLIFYADKKPIMGKSVGSQAERTNMSPEEIAEWIESQVGSDKLDMLNKFPFAKMSNYLNPDAKEFTKYSKDMEEILKKQEYEFDSKKESKHGHYFESSAYYHPLEFINAKTKNSTKLISLMVPIFYEVSKANSSEPLKNMESILSNEEDLDKKKEIIDEMVQNLGYEDGQMNTDLYELMISIQHFTYRAILDYCLYFYPFFTDLYEGYNKEMTIAQLFNNLKTNLNPENVILDYLIDGLDQIGNDDDLLELLRNSEKLQEEDDDTSLHGKLFINTYKLIKTIYVKQFDSFEEINKSARSKLIRSEQYKEILLFLIKKLYFQKYAEHIIPLIEKAFYELPAIKTAKLEDIKTGDLEKTFSLRKYLRIIGFVDYVQELDEEYLDYSNLEIFVKSRRRNILI